MAKLPYFQHLCINHTNDLSTSGKTRARGQFRDHGSVNKIRTKLESMIEKLAASNEYHPIEKAVLLQAIIHQDHLTMD